jgi:signal transduction histidine kinase
VASQLEPLGPHTPRSEQLQQLITLHRNNIVGDLVVLGPLIGCGLYLQSGWFSLIGVTRLVVLAFIWIGRAPLLAGRTDEALWWWIGGHMVGVAATAFIAPALSPLLLTIMLGAIVLTSHLSVRQRPRVVYAVVGTIVLTGVFTFQDVTDLDDRLPVPFAVTVIALHTMATGLQIPLNQRAYYAQLRRSVDQVRNAEDRQVVALSDERAALSRSLERGPLRDLDQLAVVIEDLQRVVVDDVDGWRERTALWADSAAQDAQRSLKSLRDISHGIYPDSLRNGLHAALSAYADRVSLQLTPVPTTGLSQHAARRYQRDPGAVRFHEQHEVCAYLVITELRAALPHDATLHATVGPNPVESGWLRLDVDAPKHQLPELRAPIRDRIDAQGGQVVVPPSGDHSGVEPGSGVSVLLPLNLPASSGQVSADRANSRILEVFIAWGLRVAVGGLIAAGAVLAFSFSLTAVLMLLVNVVLVTALSISMRFARSARDSLAVVMLCGVAAITAPIGAALAPELAPAMGLLAMLPTVLSLPHFSSRILSAMSFVQVLALTIVGLIAYFDEPVIETVVPLAVPLVAVPTICGALGAMVISTMNGFLAVISDETARARVSLQRVVDAADEHRRSIERNLHDGAQQQFVALSMQLRIVAKKLSRPIGGAQVAAMLSDLQTSIVATRNELRVLADGALSPDIAMGRLGDALSKIAALTPRQVSVELVDADVMDPELAGVVYFCCVEALQNALKHGGSSVQVHLLVSVSASELQFSVTDNGPGFAVRRPFVGGLASIEQRVVGRGGTMDVESHADSGTVIRATVPT